MNCTTCQEPLAANALVCERCGAPTHSTLPSMSHEHHEAPVDSLLGRVLAEKYKLTRRISAGGFGAVYEATHIKLESRVAIKMLHAGLSQNPLVVERFRREALATSKIQNPNAVKVYDRGTTEDGILWLAMEFVEGETLDDRLSRGPLSEQELFDLMGPICEVLFEAHQKKIIHRDLKPQNIMLVSVGGGRVIPKVLDFGIAALRDTGDSLTNSGAVSGTPKYMAPEQWEGSRHTDARADIYALGVLSYHCLSGRLPFEADTPLAWMKQHCIQPPLDLSVAMSGRPFSASTRDAIMGALEKEPSKRPQDTMAFFHAMTGRTPLATPAPIVSISAPVSGDNQTLAQIAPEVAPSAIELKAPSKSPILFGALALSAVGVLLWMLLSPQAPTTQTIRSASAPASASFVANPSTKKTEPTTAITPSVTQPTTLSPEAEKSAELRRECLRLIEAKRLDEAQKSCAKVDDAQASLDKLREEVRQRYIKQIEESLASNKPADALLQKLVTLSPRDPMLEELKRRNQEARKKALWAKLQAETGDPNKFCKMLAQYLSLDGINAEELKAAAKLLENAGSSDVAECEPLFKKLSL